MTSALKIHTGMKLSHFNTTSGNLTLRTNMNGIIRGNQVTSAQPIISQIIEAVVVICPSPPQLSQRSLLQQVLLRVRVQYRISHT